MPEKRTGEKTGQERGSVCKAADAPVGLKTEKEKKRFSKKSLTSPALYCILFMLLTKYMLPWLSR